MKDVGSMSVSLILNVQTLWLVEMKSVLIHVRIVQSMLTAQQEITGQFVYAELAIVEILMDPFAQKVSSKAVRKKNQI